MLEIQNPKINAKSDDEDSIKIKESKFYKQSNLDTYNDMTQEIENNYKKCHLSTITEEDLFNTIIQSNNQKSLCLQKAEYDITKLQNELSVKQMIETNLIIKQYFHDINTTLETAIKAAKKTNENRKKYVSG